MKKVNIKVEKHQDHCLIQVNGSFTVQHAKSFKESMKKALTSSLPVRLCLENVSSLDVTAIQLSIALKRALASQERNLHITFPTNTDIISLLNKSGITKIYQYV